MHPAAVSFALSGSSIPAGFTTAAEGGDLQVDGYR